MSFRDLLNPLEQMLYRSRFARKVAYVVLGEPRMCIEHLELRRAQLWVSEDLVVGFDVTVVSGNVWITQDGNLQDALLAPGENHQCADGGTIVIQALEPSVVRIARAVESSCLRKHQTN
jgi:hypothetical protein